ncbi:hypothetical protein [Stigmatella aurantiaca]|uniref:Asl1-like glycosyl hydrolase catalytic domain-containing protein n=1 Tax=Stigmatella aurantiaca (strain DW4/3-1) TaxID=378806 RepID=Q095Y4_STIAD|nr:hypothetical protein [Stigmatella aurantiaca]ADO74948.1 uncharacterized protein STAUR_7192 [Stigmatella aurantiaca DW4/3-1]EAU67536.1 hypothetical protein STIAU_5909 [Stigmatella aurantiaca DW4/3-1]
MIARIACLLLLGAPVIAAAQSPGCVSTTAHVPNFVQATSIDTNAKRVRVYVNGVTSTSAGYFQVQGPNNQWVGADAVSQGDGSWYADVDLTGFGSLTGTFTMWPWLWNSTVGGVFAPCPSSTFTRVLPNPSRTVQVGTNYNWDIVDTATCAYTAASRPFLKNYHLSGVRANVQAQLARMRENQVETLRFFAGWGDNQYQAGIGVVIFPPTTTLPQQFLANLRSFLDDVRNAGFSSVVIGLGGAGSYDYNNPNADFNGLLLPTYKNAVQQIVQAAAGYGPPEVLFDLGNEIGASPYEPQSQITRKATLIKEVWTKYLAVGGVRAKASFSAHFDPPGDSSRLRHLIEALRQSGQPMPDWLSVHIYGQTQSEVYSSLGAVFQTYSDYGYRAGQATPKWTMIGESFQEHQPTVAGINDYFAYLDSYVGGGINLKKVFGWPISPSYPYCASPSHIKGVLGASVLRAGLR